MDINNDLQQINTFVKGMNTDVSDALMDSSQYRYAENVRLATNTEENTGELRLIEGTKQFPYDRGNIKAMTSIRDIIIVITDDSKIWKKDTTKPNAVFEPVFEPDFGGETLDVDHLSLVTRWENEKDVKLYIADGKHPLMYINIMDPDGTVHGLENTYMDVQKFLPPIKDILVSVGGRLPAVKIQYAYRLYTEGGSTTTLSPLSSPIVLYEDYNVGYKYSETEPVISNKQTSFSITGTFPSNLDFILVFRITYVQSGHEPTINLIYDGPFKRNFVDSGYNVELKSVAEFKSMLGLDFKPRVIESKNDYLFAANLNYGQDETDNVTFSLADEAFRCYSSGDKDGDSYRYNRQFDSENILNYNESFWLKEDGTVGGEGEMLSWRFVTNNVTVSWDNKKTVNEGLTYAQIQSLKPGEVYRYGVILHTDTGKKSSVVWIADIMAKELQVVSNLNMVALGVEFTADWSSIHAKYPLCTALEFVRCPRTVSDKLTITTGIGGFPYEVFADKNHEYFQPDSDITTNILCPTGYFSLNRFFAIGKSDALSNLESGNAAYTTNKFLMFSSPEYCYLPDDIRGLMAGEIKVVVKGFGYIDVTKDSRYTVYNDPRTDTVAGGFIGKLQTLFTHDNKNNRPFRFALDTRWKIKPWLQYSHPLPENYSDESKYMIIYDASAANYLMYLSNRARGDAQNGHETNDPLYDNNHNAITCTAAYINLSNENVNLTSRVKDVSYPTVPDTSKAFGENNTFDLMEDRETIGSYSFIKWSVPLLYGIDDLDQSYSSIEAEHMFDHVDRDGYPRTFEGSIPYMYPISAIGRLILFELDLPLDFYEMSELDPKLCVPIIDLKIQLTPYGGEDGTKMSTYVSYGKYILSDGLLSVKVFDGDCYPGVFNYNVGHSIYRQATAGVFNSTFYAVPTYSEIDLSATYGELFSNSTNSRRYLIQDRATIFDQYNLTKDSYLYNTAYGSEPSVIPYNSIYYSSVASNSYDTRILYSNKKTNGETVDSWLTFNTLDFLDADSRFGQITNMRLFKDTLLFWQEHATGILSVNERSLVNDLDDNAIILGTGGTLSRYDYISTSYGMKPYQHEAETLSSYALYWWDGYSKEILAYGGGNEVVPLTKTKGLTNYINNRSESDHPMLAFDPKYDEVLAQVVSKDNVKETLTYNELIQAFSSVYTFAPLFRAIIDKDLYLTNEDTMYQWNKQHVDNYSLLFNKPAFPKVRMVVNKNNIYTKTFDNLTFGGRMYKGSLPTIVNWPMQRGNGEYIKEEHLNSPMHHLIFTFETPLKQKSAVRGDNAVSIDEYDYRLAIPRNGQDAIKQIKDDNGIHNTVPRFNDNVDYGNRMRGKTMQCEIASDYNSTDFSLQYITTKFRMSWS